jgi:hypothetical protein
MRSQRRYGSPVSDSLGFVGTTLGREMREQADKAEKELRVIGADMSLAEANKWLASNYPNLQWAKVVRNSIKRTSENEKFPNSEKRIMLGGN